MHPVNFAFALVTIIFRKVVENFITEPPPSELNFLNFTPCAAAVSGIILMLYTTLQKQRSFKIRMSPSRQIFKILGPKKLESRSTICHLHRGRSTSSWGSNNWRLRDAFLRDTQNSLKSLPSSSTSLSWRSCGSCSNFGQNSEMQQNSPRIVEQDGPSSVISESTPTPRKFIHYQPYGDCNFRQLRAPNTDKSKLKKQKITRKTRSGRTYTYMV